MSFSRIFTTFSTNVSKATGKPITFVLCLVAILVWGASGPVFHFSDTWQLVINTSTTIITFLQVFLIQNTQNRDGAALQAKLDELIRVGAAQNRYIGIERLTEEELEDLRSRCETRARADRLSDAAEAANEAERRVAKRAAAAAEEAVS
ncbi:low affinity iron permease family protein [Alsobacter sp. KACC 23698]|uniref:Low affinity iron permease family protein n=1 Tax=Alsobacter sp. KACC 23698 TaxID=3149229 RepID=A0AAU7J9I9_9HYPH